MKNLCRLCAKEKTPEQLACSIEDQALSIEQKLVYCCGWNLLITSDTPNDELPKKICRVCFRHLESSWAFAELVAQAQEQLLALMTDIKPVLPIIEYESECGENDGTNDYLEDVKVESLILNTEMNSIQNVVEENKTEFVFSESDHNQQKHRKYIKLSTFKPENITIENVEPIDNCTSNDPEENQQELSESDFDKQLVCKKDYIPKSIRRTMVIYFKQKKTAVKSHRLLTKTYGNLSPSLKTCRKWLQRFKAGDSELMEHYGRSKKFRDDELQALLDENPARSLRDFSDIFGVTTRTIWKRLHTMGKIYEDGKWIAKELPIIENVNETAEHDEISLEDIKVELIPNNSELELDMEECKSELSLSESNDNQQKRKERDKRVNIETSFERDSVSNDSGEIHSDLSESDFKKKRVPKTPYIPKRIRQKMFQYFEQNKAITESHRMLAQTYGHLTPSLNTCRKWFGRFKAGDLNLNKDYGRPKKFRNSELQALLDENPVRSLQELSDILGVTKPTIWTRLHNMGKMYEDGKWVAKKPPIIEDVNETAENDEINARLKDIKVEIIPNNSKLDFERDRNQQKRNDSTSNNNPEENRLQLSESDFNKQGVCKAHYIPKCIRHTMLSYFEQNKTAAESQRLLAHKYGNLAPALKTCKKWLGRFKAGNMNLIERYGPSKKFSDIELQALLDENPARSCQELCDIIGVTRHTIWKRLHTMGKACVDGKWIAKELSIEPSESIEEIEAFPSPISDFGSDSTSNHPEGTRSQQSKSDIKKKLVSKTPYLSKNVRQMMFHCFKQNKTIAESHRLLAQNFGHLTPSINTCRKWFGRFKVGDSNLKEQYGRPKKFRDIELQALLDENPARSLQELSDILGATKPTIWSRLHSIGKVYENGKWIEKNEQNAQADTSK